MRSPTAVVDLTIVATMSLDEAEKTLARLVPSDPLFGPLADAVDRARKIGGVR